MPAGAAGRLVYVNILMVPDVLADEDWAAQLTEAHRRGLTPLFWTHVAPYGEVELDLSSPLALSGPAQRRPSRYRPARLTADYDIAVASWIGSALGW